MNRTLSLALAALLTAVVGVAGAEVSASAPAPAPAPAAAPIPLPSADPFYTYAGTKPLSQVARGTVLKTRSVTVGVPQSGQGMLPATQILYRTQDQQKKPSVTVTTVVNPTGPANAGLVAYLSFYDAL